jgi:hypothetical protein
MSMQGRMKLHYGAIDPWQSSSLNDFLFIFLEPLVDELMDDRKSVNAYDAYHHEDFKLLVVVIWCIHDYLALSILVG